MVVFDKVKQEITCPYCQSRATPDKEFKPRDASTTRYGCVDGGHYFAVPTRSVATK